MLNKKEINEVLDILANMYEDPDKNLLHFETPFEALIATMLSAQSTDKRVNAVTSKLFKVANTPKDFANMDINELENWIKSIGIYKNKAKNIKETSKILVQDYQGEVPNKKSELIKLPGVGNKTANVVLANAFDIPAFAVDTHVFRVSNRIGLADGKNVEQTEDQLTENVPKKDWNITHKRLITHGRAICKARNPLCEECELNKLCLYNRSKND
ncbi:MULTISPECIES: endonuclease III [Anaerococcus]|nr:MULTISPECIES: endonuclease III [Anaerococcus]MDU2599512.1 endonuclease III [Anaerococcus sp.]MDU3177661.1 endonuclease III [Anaerococcus sp.]MDU7412125.1 endonuclease III [Anaerococcus sp.]